MQVCLCTETRLVRISDLYAMAGALELNGRHCATAWGLVPPAVDVISEARNIPNGAFPIVFLDNASGDPTELAAHYWDPFRNGPAARVYVENASAFNQGANSVAEAASHELVEMLVDPRVDLWTDYPGKRGKQVAVEVADPVQTHYLINANRSMWQMANFVTPSWFDSRLAANRKGELDHFLNAGRRLDWNNELRAPGEIGPEGYAIVRTMSESGWATEAMNRAGSLAVHKPERAGARAHPWSRTNVRGVSHEA